MTKQTKLNYNDFARIYELKVYCIIFSILFIGNFIGSVIYKTTNWFDILTLILATSSIALVFVMKPIYKKLKLIYLQED